MKESIESQAGNTLLDEGLKFGVMVRGKEKVFTIKGLRAGTIIAISKLAGRMQQMDGNREAIPAMLEGAANLKLMCRIIALAVLNNRWMNVFAGVMGWFFLNRLTPKEISQVTIAVVKQMNVEDFFFTMQLIAGANILRKVEPKEEKPSGEVLQE